MNALIAIKEPQVTRSNATLEQILAELSQYGDPTLSKHDSGWYCRINVFVTGDGVQFKVETDFKNPTATGAAAKCLDRLMESLRKLGK